MLGVPFVHPDPIVGIDVSEDGQWVLATCKKYLILVNTAFTDDKTGMRLVESQ